jgi:hypothetical protein
MKRNELVAVAKENGMTKAHSTKSVELVSALEEMGVLVNGELVKKKDGRGRPVDPNSERQLRLKAMAERAEANGGKIPLGRAIDPNSERQKRLAAQAAKAEANGGVLKRGRNVDPNSARQKALAEKQAKIDAGIVIKRGRPAKAVEVSDEKAAK